MRSNIHAFNQKGLAGLIPGHSPGRSSKLTWIKVRWEDLLNQSPGTFALRQTGSKTWTQALLIACLAAYYGIDLSQAAMCKALRAAGVRWRRAKLRVHSPDPLCVVKRDQIETFRQQAFSETLTAEKASRPPTDDVTKRAVFAYFDATDLP